ncbi:glutamate decarboxylase [Blastomyces dermatitidis ATCC 18188]|uniref:Glutamate decarboxylase n=1 Tax=Ajellomyces dermatitidis (strain ATCC 18188 / CBS 674.68) TaxID=653446 RepID=A0A0J9HCB7_AJEDA|nr:glutamate decarboxylase [Blastomyces dermatitidis ATCC 18188]
MIARMFNAPGEGSQGHAMGPSCIGSSEAIMLGTTYTGQYEDVQAINDLIVQRGIDCPIHVDAPSTRYWMGGLALSRVSPKERFNINYLGAEQASFTLNFSKVLHKSSVKRGYVP